MISVHPKTPDEMTSLEEMGRYLITQGADVHEEGLVRTAALYGHLGLVKLLIVAGADYQKPVNGETVIDAVKDRGDHKAEMLKFLTEEAPLLHQRNQQKKEANRAQEAHQTSSSASTATTTTTTTDTSTTTTSTPSSSSDEKKAAGHIMLSYQWDDQPTIIKIKQALATAGYTVWLDVEQMGGSTLQAMADAVEGSAVICVAASAKYAASANCRLEGEYALQQRKTIVPFMMEKGYRPSGWLGMLMGSKLYFDFSDKSEAAFTKKAAELAKELTRYMKPIAPPTTTTPSPPVETKAPDYVSWDADKTMAWIGEKCGETSSFKERLNGGSLEELARLRVQDPSHHFISFLLAHLTPKLTSALALSKALVTLR